MRVAAYRDIRGYLARPMAYAIEESDVGLQLFVRGWQVFSAEELRVYHDTDRTHHEAAEVTASTITNLALLAFLHYPAMDLGRGAAQVANRVAYSVRRGRIRGVASGVGGIVTECYRNRALRAPIRHEVLMEYLRLRQSEADPIRIAARRYSRRACECWRLIPICWRNRPLPNRQAQRRLHRGYVARSGAASTMRSRVRCTDTVRSSK